MRLRIVSQAVLLVITYLSTLAIGRGYLAETGQYALVVMLMLNYSMLPEALIIRETVTYSLVLVLFVHVCTKDLPRTSLNALALGGIVGLAMLLRPSGVVLLPVRHCRRSGVLDLFGIRSIARTTLSSLIVVVSALAIVAPWQAFLYRHFQTIEIGGSCTGGMNLFKGNHPTMEGVHPTVDVDLADGFIESFAREQAINLNINTEELNICQRDALLERLAISAILENPMDFAKRIVYKAFYFFYPVHIPVGVGELTFNSHEGRLTIEKYRYMVAPRKSFATLYNSVLVTAAFAGLFLALRSRVGLQPVLVVFLVVAAHAALHSITWPEFAISPTSSSPCCACLQL